MFWLVGQESKRKNTGRLEMSSKEGASRWAHGSEYKYKTLYYILMLSSRLIDRAAMVVEIKAIHELQTWVQTHQDRTLHNVQTPDTETNFEPPLQHHPLKGPTYLAAKGIY